VVRPWAEDRALAPDLEAARQFLSGEAVARVAGTLK
jgi:hypothetical protein